jgi:MFS family permease
MILAGRSRPPAGPGRAGPRVATRLDRVLARYRSVFAIDGLPRLLATALLGRLPQGMSVLAILLLVRGAVHSYVAAGLASGGYSLACALAAPLQGRLVDRIGRARVLVPCALGQSVVFVALIIGAHRSSSGVLLVGLSLLAGALQPALAPSVRALIGDLVADPDLRESAYALESVVQELIWITGPLVIAVLVATVSASAGLVASCVSCVLGTTLFVTSPAARGHGHGATGREHRRMRLGDHPELRALMLPTAMMGLSIGAVDVGLPSLALHAHSRPSSGLLLAMWSVGSLLGGLGAGARHWRLSLSERYRRLLVIAVLCTAPLIGARTIWEGLIGALLAGVTIAPTFSCQYALASRAAPAGAVTEAFTWVASALVLGVAAGSALGGAVIGPLGVSGPFAIGVAGLVVAAGVAVRVRRPQPAAA